MNDVHEGVGLGRIEEEGRARNIERLDAARMAMPVSLGGKRAIIYSSRPAWRSATVIRMGNAGCCIYYAV